MVQKGASDKIAGATLEEYRAKINADTGDVGDEIAKALEELESAQTALDNTKQESVSHLQRRINVDDNLSLTVTKSFVSNIDVAFSISILPISHMIG